MRAKAHIGIGREMKDPVGPLHGLHQPLQIENIAADQPKAGRLLRRREKPGLPGGEVIVADHHVAVAQQTIHQVTADKTRTAYDKVTQFVTSSALSGGSCQSPSSFTMQSIVPWMWQIRPRLELEDGYVHV